METSNKIYFIGTAGTSSGWRRGLPALVNTYDSVGVLQRQVMTIWTQDNASVSFQLNPRVTETNVYDPAGNRARTEITYQQVTFANGTSCQLPRDSYEYAANATTKLRSTRTDYNTSTTYTDRRIIGLVSEKLLYEGDVTGTLMTKVAFNYDESGSIQGTAAPVQHDNTNYTASFVAGRANLSSVKRYDVTNTLLFTTTSSKYNTAGSVVSSKDASNHEVQISYADSFSDNNNSRNTLAYATTVTDPDGYSSTSKYHFDFGAVTYTRTPQPNLTTNTPGPEQAFTFDTIGRPQQITNLVNNAYTRFDYPSSQTRINTYATIQEGQGEALSFKIADGHGRVIATATDHPGSVGGYSGQKIVYDVIGRVIKTSNPAETSADGAPSQWVTAGDDAAGGWIYTEQSYDWKGRSRVTTNPDLTTKEASYVGCGCAGGVVTTLTDEGVIDAGVLKRRQQKVYSDVLGRTVKTELLNWQGGSVYSTTVNTYNARDQLTQIRQYAGGEGSGTFQDTTLTYDGYGRLKTKHTPEQATGVATTYDYFADDNVQKVTDARGASATYAYNGRHKMTSIAYAAPVGITPTPNVSFGYDAVGNRKLMSDGLGSVTYGYDQLSRLLSESRDFTGVGNYTISYQYNLASDLMSITDPLNTTINYTRDKIGRLNSVARPGQTFASTISYRASGAMKHMLYGDNSTMNVTFNSKMQPTTFTIPGRISKTYTYNADGTLGFSSDLMDHRFDRSYSFDHVGRLTKALSGAEARGEGTTTDRPYNQTYGYDTFGNLNQRNLKTWWTGDSTMSASYVSNRRQGWNYDADGRQVDGDDHYEYDASGRNHYLDTYGHGSVTMTYDGDGGQSKTFELSYDGELNEVTEGKYYLRSSVLGGQVLAEIDESGIVGRRFVYAGPTMLAWVVGYSPFETISWEQRDPSGATVLGAGQQELDPLGADAGTFGNSVPPTEEPLLSYGSSYSPANPGVTYSVDGIRVPANDFMAFAGMALRDPLGILESFARSSARPIGTRNTGVSWGRRFEVIYDANDEIVSFTSEYDPELSHLNFGTESPIYSNDSMPDLAFLQQDILPLPADLRSRVEKIVNKPNTKCAEFIKKLLTAAAASYGEAHSYNPMDLFDRVEKEGGFRLKKLKKSYAGAAGIEGGKRVVFIQRRNSDPNPEVVDHTLNGYAKTVLQELMHHAKKSGVYTDRDLAKSIFSVLTPEEQRANGLPSSTDVEINSKYFHSVLNLHCKSITGE